MNNLKINNKEQKTAVITGASEGIGAAFAKLLIKKGWQVIGISRSSRKLNQISKNFSSDNKSFKYFSCDVQDFKIFFLTVNFPAIMFFGIGKLPSIISLFPK